MTDKDKKINEYIDYIDHLKTVISEQNMYIHELKEDIKEKDSLLDERN